MRNIMMCLLFCAGCTKAELQETQEIINIEKHDYVCYHNIMYTPDNGRGDIRYFEELLNITEDSIQKYAQKETYSKQVFMYFADTAYFVQITKTVTYSQIISKDVKPIFTK